MTDLNTDQNHEQIHKMFMDSDIKNWKEEIEIITLETDFYKKLIQSHNHEYKTWGEISFESLFHGINEIVDQNEIFESSFLKYNNKIHGIAECDDLQCESYFLNEHARLKEDIENHFSNYKKFKKLLFEYLKTRYNY